MTPEQYYERELAEFHEQFEAGHMPALFKAVEFCGVCKIPLPEWATLAVLNQIIAHYHYAPATGQRGKPSPKSRYTKDYIDFLRWVKFEGACIFLRFDYTERKRGGRPKRDGGTVTVDMVCAEAQQRLQGTIAEDSRPDQILASWKKVKEARDAGNDARYRSFT